MTVPLCNSLEDLAGVVHETSEQHKGLRSSLQTKENVVVDCFMKWLTAHSPFESRPANMSVTLSTVVIANEFVNCDGALSVGINPREDMIGKTFADVKLQHTKKRVKSLSSINSSMKIRGQEAVFHLQQMLNRVLSITDSTTDSAAYIKYELVPRPPSLFDDMSMRRPAKAALASILLPLVTPGPFGVPHNAIRIDEGGYLPSSHRCMAQSSHIYRDLSELHEIHSDSLSNGCNCCL